MISYMYNIIHNLDFNNIYIVILIKSYRISIYRVCTSLLNAFKHTYKQISNKKRVFLFIILDFIVNFKLKLLITKWNLKP